MSGEIDRTLFEKAIEVTATALRGAMGGENSQPPAYAAEQRGDFVGNIVVDVSDKSQRHMIVLRIDPAGAGEAAPQGGQRLRNADGNFQASEQARHDTIKEYRTPQPALHPSHMGCCSRIRAISSSTLGRMRATMKSTPAALG